VGGCAHKRYSTAKGVKKCLQGAGSGLGNKKSPNKLKYIDDNVFLKRKSHFSLKDVIDKANSS
jgi:hypothetical protein